MSEQRDLYHDLKWSNPTPIAKEWLERALKAEEELARLGKRFPVTIDKKTQVIVDRKAFDACMGDNAALREENDLQRDSIQRLSAQVVAYRDGLKEMQARCEFRIMDDDGHYENYHEAKDLLSSPDPGAEIRKRLAKLEAVATVAGAISSGCYDANIWDKLKQALAEMEGGHR